MDFFVYQKHQGGNLEAHPTESTSSQGRHQSEEAEEEELVSQQ